MELGLVILLAVKAGALLGGLVIATLLWPPAGTPGPSSAGSDGARRLTG